MPGVGCRNHITGIILVAAAFLLSADPGAAQYRPDPRDTRQQRACGGADGVTAEQQIAACSAILAKERDVRNRAIALDYRARGRGKLKQFDAALVDINEAIRLQPNDADFLTNRGVIFLEMGELDRAVQDYSDAIRMNPNDYKAYFNRATDRRDKNEIDEALDDLSAALKINPKYASAFRLRASILEDRGQFDAALRDVSEALRLDPKDARAINLRGLILEGKGSLDDAVRDYTQAIALDSMYAGYLFNRGRAYRLMERYDLSIKDYDRGLQINPELSTRWRGMAFLDAGNFESALKDFDLAIRHDPNKGWNYLYRGRALIAKGETERGQEDLRRARELTPTIAKELTDDAVNYRIRANVDKRYLIASLRDLDSAIAVDPDYAPGYYQRAMTRLWIAGAAGRFDDEDALRDFDRAIALQSDNVDALVGRGDVLRNRGNFAGAVADYDRALALVAEGSASGIGVALRPKALDARCHALSQLGLLDKALEDCNEAKRMQPYIIPTNRALVFFKLGRLDEAIADYDVVLKLFPKNAFALYGRGLARRGKGDVAGGGMDLVAARTEKADVGATFSSWFGVVEPPSTTRN